MSIEVQRRRGTTAQHSTFTGASGEITVDTDKLAVVVHDGVTPGGHPHPKLDVAQEWPAIQAFSAGVTGGVVTVSAPGAAQSVALDGRVHVIELADATETTITGSPTGTGYSSAIVRIKGSAAGTGTIAWAVGHVAMNTQDLNAGAGKYTDFMLDSHDGSTVFYRGVGVQPA